MTHHETLALLRREQYFRTQHFPPSAANETAFALLLEAADFRARGERAQVTALGLNYAVPHATRARHLAALCKDNLLQRTPDKLDARRSWVDLTPMGSKLLESHLAKLEQATQ